MKQGFIATTILAGLMGLAGGSIAQTTATPAAPDPAKGGEASTKKSIGNTANPTQRPDGSNPASRDAVKSEARAANRNNADSMVPKGEASTMTNNQPNMSPKPSGEMSRQEVSQQARKTKPQMGQTGQRPDVPTNPTNRTGTPQ